MSAHLSELAADAPEPAIWHELECGRYRQDLGLWRELARRFGDPVLEVGAGTGRVALELARAGHSVTALDHDPVLLAELGRRARGLPVRTTAADARSFELGGEFALVLAPMQLVQLLGGAEGRRAFLGRVRRHLRPRGAAALAIVEELELFEESEPGLAPDACELDGVRFASQPVAVSVDGDGFVLRRRRRVSAPGSRPVVTEDAVRLDQITASELEADAVAAGLALGGRAWVPATRDHTGSTVVIVHG